MTPILYFLRISIFKRTLLIAPISSFTISIVFKLILFIRSIFNPSLEIGEHKPPAPSIIRKSFFGNFFTFSI